MLLLKICYDGHIDTPMNSRHAAFTLIETVIAITLLTVVVTAVTGLLLVTILGNQRNRHSLQATAYAQEGLEAMRYLRDSNWRQNYAWNRGFEASDFGDRVLYLAEGDCPPCWSLSPYEQDGELENANGHAFVRSIVVRETEQEETLEVTARVEWEDKGVDREVELSTYLSNWK